MSSFAIFRLPHAKQAMLIRGEAQTIPSLLDLDQQEGFILAPFAASQETPILLIRPEQVEEKTSSDICPAAQHISPNSKNPTADYSADFACFHKALNSGLFRKLVLARQAIEPNDGTLPTTALFELACQRYPRMFIALVHTPQSGTWLTATPEILLDNISNSEVDGDNAWRTIALAGTMQRQGQQLQGEGELLDWSVKNIQEQRYVTSYIADTLTSLGLDFREEGPRTVRAADLVHLRSDFTFHIDKCTRVGELLQALHPTPAVCGLPKAEALDFILKHEHTPRAYYSGFMGPLNMTTSQSPSPATHLYVSLRCMQITDGHYCLYAGGGLLPSSSCQKEWLETEAKMETMRQLITPHSLVLK